MAAPSWSALLANEAIIAMAGHEAFARALVYARTGRVGDVRLDPETLTITGRVRGTYRDAYATTIRLADPRDPLPGAHRGSCSCPVALDCKHAAAVLVVARGQAAITAHLDRPGWERSLEKLVQAADPPPVIEVVDLALEFEVQEIPAYRGYPGRRELRGRPVQRGRSGKWVRSGIDWDDLDHVTRRHPAEQRELLLQLRAATGPGARFVYPKSPWISFATVSGGLWSLLAGAQETGLALLSPGPGQPPVRVHPGPAAVALDAHRRPDALVLEPRVLVDGRSLPATDAGLLGDPAHGVFCWQPGEGTAPHRELTLVPLAEPLGRELRQVLVEAQVLEIPGRDEQRFREDFLPVLTRKAPLVSSDGSVELPPPPVPVLGLTCTFRPEHRLRLDWVWHYASAAGDRAYPLDEPAARAPVRDPAAEAALLAALDLPYDRLPQLRDGRSGHRPAPSALLADLQVVWFCEQLLPGLEAAGVRVEVLGDRPDYRRADGNPVVELAAVERPDGSDWFDLRIQVSLEGEVIPFDTLFVALNRGDEFLVLDTGVYLPLQREEFVRLRELIEEARALQEHEGDELRISRSQASLWEDLVQLGVVVEQSDSWARSLRGLADVTAVDPVEVPATLHAELRPYQVDGYRWLAFLRAHGLGGILADDMGLGKTLQTLALVCRAREQEPGGPPFLVVAPTSVVPNWAAEAARFAPGLRVVMVTGSQAKRGTALADLVAGADLVVTSYTLLRIDFGSYEPLPWSALLLDEAQFVKNHRSKSYQCVRRLPAPFKLAITGTPMENSLMDLWALLSIVAPGLFPHPERFSEYYRRPIERGHDPGLLAQLRRRIRPLVLRRTKETVAPELPPKVEQVIEVVLQPRHLRIYQTHLQRERQKVLGLIDDLDGNRFTILSSITLLRQLSLDAGLVDAAYAGVPSSKIETLVEHLDEVVAEGHRALVFSQFTGFLHRVRDRLDAAGTGYAYLDGSTRDRAAAVQEFRSGDKPVFLISLKAGGFGLNLTEADYCFVLDPWWNPAAEAQAVDRAHRIGQSSTVMVYRLVAQGTIEEKVMALKARKEQLFDSVMGDDALSRAALTADEIRSLLA